MKDIDKQQRQAEFLRKYTLGPEQLKKLLEDKIARARHYSEANKQREVAQGQS